MVYESEFFVGVRIKILAKNILLIAGKNVRDNDLSVFYVSSQI